MGIQRDKQGQITLEDLAVMVQNGFMEMDQSMNNRFDAVDREITELKHQTTKLVERFLKLRK